MDFATQDIGDLLIVEIMTPQAANRLFAQEPSNSCRFMSTVSILSFLTLIFICLPIGADSANDCGDRDALFRLEALAKIQTLQVDLLSHNSATETLERWCRRWGQSKSAIITAEQANWVDPQPTAEIREHLRIGPEVQLKFRHVRLKCSEMVLSEADNWYVPARLTPVMNKTLESSETPFGKVVKPLGFSRRILSADLLWPDFSKSERIPVTSSSKKYEDLGPPYLLFEHRALLQNAHGMPFSFLIERYTRNLLKPM